MKKIVIVFILISSGPAMADFEFYRGIRQMGMGGASIAVVNDETSVLSNANGLGRLRDYFFTLFDPEISLSAAGAESMLDKFSLESSYNGLSGNVDQPFYSKVQLFPSIVLPNFGFGILGRYESLMQRNSDGTLSLNYQNDYALVSGMNLRFWGGRIKIGATGKLINRIEFFGVRDPASESLDTNSFANEGMALGLDTGLTLAAPWQWIPTLAVLVRDVGHTSFTFGDGFLGAGGAGDPNAISQSIDAAFSIFPIFTNHIRGTLTGEYTGLTTPLTSTESAMDRVHIGMELNVYDKYFFRAGWHDNSWTAGFEFAAQFFQWQLATYGEEVVIGGTPQSDRRALVKMALRF